ncbi:MAG: hypothetical protein ACRD0V_07175 [Acidimicrobiales bacterium]
MGAAPSPRQVRQVTVRIEQLAPGELRLVLPGVPGWAVVARTQPDLARAVAAAFCEAQIGAYSDWREPAGRRRPARRAQHRGDVHDPREWRLAADGRWVSPGGRRYQAQAQVVRRVTSRLVGMGLSATPEPAAERGRTGVLRGRV